MPTITTDLVGAHFRPPSLIVLANLPGHCPLVLQPEPANPYDAKAIKVLVDLAEEENLALAQSVEDAGYEWRDLLDGGPFPLGYIGDSDGKVCRQTGRPGNREVGQVLYRAEVGEIEAAAISAVLTFTPDGKPLVKVEYP